MPYGTGICRSAIYLKINKYFFKLLLLFLDIPFYVSLIWHRVDKLVLFDSTVS